MTKRQRKYRKAANIARRNMPKTSDGSRRKDKLDGTPTQFRRYHNNLT